MAIKLEDLKDSDIGRKVSYRNYHNQKDAPGTLANWNHRFIFVNYGNPDNNIATRPEDLTFIEEEAPTMGKSY